MVQKNHCHLSEITQHNRGNMIDLQHRRNLPVQVSYEEAAGLTVDSLLKGLSWLDRLLAPLVLIAMILGVVIGMSLLARWADK